ncbi:dihydroorotase [Candidatus Desantisbacteria bacterium CG2_30_40_21]|uniref:Dihydroorotase n=4 Tax=unclassified Candidatus Desantisiibacteriota TaxID=3106372 RepID=A0A2M7JAS2_9BACT|nr:MAG: dihydroorotase [Candidatus Desantisbacteria bacterium CG2_30_40_21]PIX16506.1 MAG: dihydroorotase [Candidatus Desantisbacteria bacterium CG_4_8_14_3_um_filter_40_12]PIY20392.1 MAG: dihydroorotase [Candidatus Desantisbacteria bacterium CG_4_10_14_3_um_filter_40_18]PJB29714.1 MAG: dihydroorotase [Candidatus Desantisbacteria bacterium CG_4_9_14_3_um_filter_40_11]
MDLLIRNGRVIDPYNHQEKIADILINDGKIVDIGAGIGDNVSASRVIDAAGKLVAPGLIDMHVHLREPGEEEKETIATGTRAAAQGGFTTIACMPNTRPVVDNQSLVEFILAKSKQEGVVRVLPIGAITKGLKGEEMAEIGQMVKAGAKAISDDGRPIENAVLMRRALEYVKQFNVPLISHCEDLTLSGGGCMNEGYYSTILGLPGIPSAAEEVMVARDIILAEETGTRLHIAHVSTRKSVELVRQAKKRGFIVTCEATPHHFTLTDKAVCGLEMRNAECGMQGFDTNTKMNPPLRSEDDVEAIRQGLSDGTIDAIATDHAPHTRTEKEQEYSKAPFGIIGLPTSLGLVLTELVDKGVLTLADALAKMTINPARILGLEIAGLVAGARADITIIDPKMEWVVDVNTFASKARNCPFHGWKLKGRAVMTIVEGVVVWEIPVDELMS